MKGDVVLYRRITAYHEAAHAVAAFRLEIPVHEIVLQRDGPHAGYVATTKSPLIAKITRECKSSLSNYELIARDTSKRVMILLAGPVAEARLLRTKLRSHHCKSDITKAMLFCRVLYLLRGQMVKDGHTTIPEFTPADLANRLRHRTAQLLSQERNWRAVSALAADLDGWGRLAGDDAAETVQWACKSQNQLSLGLPMPQRREGIKFPHEELRRSQCACRREKPASIRRVAGLHRGF